MSNYIFRRTVKHAFTLPLEVLEYNIQQYAEFDKFYGDVEMPHRKHLKNSMRMMSNIAKYVIQHKYQKQVIKAYKEI